MRALVMAAVLVTLPARADEAPRKLEIGAAAGYALPIGSAERGSRLGDMTFGMVPLELAGSYRLSGALAIQLMGIYAPVVPKLCTGGSDCISSVGRTWVLSARAHILLPRFHTLVPYADLGVGYEWFKSNFADSGVASSRAYDGPILLSTELGAPFVLGKGWTLGPALGLSIGTYVHAHLDTPAFSNRQNVDNRTFHAWASLSARIGAAF